MLRALIAFDDSPSATEAIEVATELLKPSEALVLHVRGPSPVDSQILTEVRHGKSLDEAMDARHALEEAASQAAADRGAQIARSAGWHAEARSTFAYGGEWDPILRLADELSPEVIILGARGLTGVRAALGSVSDAVVHRARQPALVVSGPRSATAGPALVAYDGSEGARAALDAATRLLDTHELLICHVGLDREAVDSAADPVLEEAISRARSAGCEARAVPAPNLGAALGLSGRAWHGLVAAANEHEARVVVIGSRGRPAASELVLGSVAMGVLHHAERPVIVAPPTGVSAPGPR